ncbi:GIY-YIG nuclease family protein [Microbacterium istanbulense]|uniref:GIY-YIG nuclease family protein n=1 Tax=Microbacterium istanbulense TaxID=3122049 RepID=A0ABU8LP40_9MICO
MPFVYILTCSDGSYYTGSTIDLVYRLAQHSHGEGGDYTRRRLPVELVWYSEFARIDDAFGWERRIHGWSRAKKQLLIDGNYEGLRGWSVRQRQSKKSEP